ncbi:nuclear receptor subfamily 2 group E member, partial [Elysia marginata]
LESSYGSLYPNLLHQSARSGLASVSNLPGLHGLHGLPPLHSLHSSFVQSQAFAPRLVCGLPSPGSHSAHNVFDKHRATLSTFFPALSQSVVCSPSYLETSFRCSPHAGPFLESSPSLYNSIYKNSSSNNNNNSSGSSSSGNRCSAVPKLEADGGCQKDSTTGGVLKQCCSSSTPLDSGGVKDHSIDTLLYASKVLKSSSNSSNNNNNSINNNSHSFSSNMISSSSNSVRVSSHNNTNTSNNNGNNNNNTTNNINVCNKNSRKCNNNAHNYSIKSIISSDNESRVRYTNVENQATTSGDVNCDKTPSPDSSSPWPSPYLSNMDREPDSSPAAINGTVTDGACVDSQTSPITLCSQRAHPSPPSLLAPKPIKPLHIAHARNRQETLSHLPGKTLVTAHHVTAVAEEILVACVTWARLLPAFSSLVESDKRRLLEATWPELFLLVAAEKGLYFEPSSLLSTVDLLGEDFNPVSSNQPSMTTKQIAVTYSHLQEMKELLLTLQGLKIDPTEGNCLRSIVLFRFYTRGLQACSEVQHLQEKAHLTLMSHCSRTYPGDLLRTNRFLVLLPRLREIPPKVVKDVFFKHSVPPDASIERVLFEFAGCSDLEKTSVTP